MIGAYRDSRRDSCIAHQLQTMLLAGLGNRFALQPKVEVKLVFCSLLVFGMGA